jgi:hypothetical protein
VYAARDQSVYAARDQSAYAARVVAARRLNPCGHSLNPQRRQARANRRSI